MKGGRKEEEERKRSLAAKEFLEFFVLTFRLKVKLNATLLVA